jgi:hypothetical protein
MATRLTLGQPKAKCPGALEHGAHERALSVYADGLLGGRLADDMAWTSRTSIRTTLGLCQAT